MLLIGLVSLPVGFSLHRYGRRTHAEERARHSDLGLRMNLKATEIIGMMIAVAAVMAIVGTLVGVVLWGDRGEPGWP